MTELAKTQVLEELLSTPSVGPTRAPPATPLPEPSPDGTNVVQLPSPTLTRSQQAEGATQLEEFFDGVVTEIADSEIRLRTISSEGEEAEAWLPKERIPADEMEYLELGVPVRVSVIVRTRPRRARDFSIRFLRPHQWYRPTPEEATPATTFLLNVMKQALGQ